MAPVSKQPRRTRAKKAKKEEKDKLASPFSDDGYVYYTTKRGVRVECLGIAEEMMVQESNIRAQIEWPDVPTYALSDDNVRVPHTEESIADPNTPEDERKAWADYKIALTEATAQFNARLAEGRLRLIATRGIRIVDYERLAQQWQTEHEWLGMSVPDDPRERLVHFFRFEVIGKHAGDIEEDMVGIAKGIYIASGVDPEVIAQGEALFRGSLGES